MCYDAFWLFFFSRVKTFCIDLEKIVFFPLCSGYLRLLPHTIVCPGLRSNLALFCFIYCHTLCIYKIPK